MLRMLCLLLMLLLSLTSTGPVLLVAGQAVGLEFSVNSWTSGDQLCPVLTTLSEGGFVVVWTSDGQDGSGLGVFGKRYCLNGTEERLPSSGTGNAVGNEFPLNSYTQNDQGTPCKNTGWWWGTAIAAFPPATGGGFMVIWQSVGQDGSGYGLFGKRFAANGSETRMPTSGLHNAVGNEFPVNSYTVDNQLVPSMAVLADGGFVVCWTSNLQDGKNLNVFGKRFAANGSEVAIPTSGWNASVGNEFLIPSAIEAAGEQGYSSVVALSTGGFLVAWASTPQDSSYLGVYAKMYASDGNEIPLAISGMNSAVGNEIAMNSFTADDQSRQSLVAFTNGSFLSCWHSLAEDGSLYGVFGKRFSSNGSPLNVTNSSMGGAVAAEFPLNSYKTNIQNTPRLFRLNDEGFVGVWNSQGQDGSGWGAYAKRYSAGNDEMAVPPSGTGNAVGNEFPVNSFTSGDQWFPVGTALEDGGFLLCWMSNGQDGSGWGVYGKRYAANGSEIPLVVVEAPASSSSSPVPPTSSPTGLPSSSNPTVQSSTTTAPQVLGPPPSATAMLIRAGTFLQRSSPSGLPAGNADRTVAFWVFHPVSWAYSAVLLTWGNSCSGGEFSLLHQGPPWVVLFIVGRCGVANVAGTDQVFGVWRHIVVTHSSG